jgi:chromosome segregation ATPase
MHYTQSSRANYREYKMANKDERLINRGPREDDEEEIKPEPFYKSSTFILVLKISLYFGVISALITGMILTNFRLGNLEERIATTLSTFKTLTEQQEIVVTNLKQLTDSHKLLERQVSTLDLESSKGELSTALKILGTQSKNIDKQLAVTRNGMISLARMVKGSRVWQEDYKGQYKNLFDENKTLKSEIESLRGVQEAEKPEFRYLEMDF